MGSGSRRRLVQWLMAKSEQLPQLCFDVVCRSRQNQLGRASERHAKLENHFQRVFPSGSTTRDSHVGTLAEFEQSRSFQSNQPIPNPSHDRTGQPVVRTDRTGQPVVGTKTRIVQDGRKTPVPRRSIHVLFTKKLSKPIERGNPLLKHTQKMCQRVPKHVLVMKA